MIMKDCLSNLVKNQYLSVSLGLSLSSPPSLSLCPPFEQRQGHLIIIQPLITSRGSRLNEVSVNTEAVHLVSPKCIFSGYLTCSQNSGNPIKLFKIWQSPLYTGVTGRLRM